GELTAAMMSQATYVNWDFQDVWGIVESDTYPFLRSLHAEGSPLPLATPRTLFISIAGIALASALILRRVKQGRPVNGGAQAGTVS
ncbi:MAG: hypothetical protein NTU83_00485, partial [Candidatus Hydrogenedentes bacterium]|nr:hypothetical protein [Candidatus Hydrogenedentota bacterium]